MRLRTHLLVSAAVGLALYPRHPLALAAVVAAGTAVDIDHLILYGLYTGDWSITGAVRYDRYRNRRAGAGDTRPRYGSLRSWIHHPLLTLPALATMVWRYPMLRPLAVGVALHLALDHADWPWRAAARLRAGQVCECCGRSGLRLRTYRRGRRPLTYAVLCAGCSVVH